MATISNYNKRLLSKYLGYNTGRFIGESIRPQIDFTLLVMERFMNLQAQGQVVDQKVLPLSIYLNLYQRI